MTRRLRPAYAFLLAATAGLFLAGCADDEPRGPRVEVVVTSVDQPAPTKLFLRSLLEDGKRWPLTPVSGGRTHVYEAVDAPDGPYSVEGDGEEGPWGMLWPFGRPPDLHRAAPEARPIQLGRPWTLYVAREAHHYRYTEEWGAFVGGGPGKEPEGPPLALRANLDEAGVAAVRFPKEAWRGRCLLLGRLVGGGVTEPVVFEAREGGLPSLRRARPAPTLPLAVHAFLAVDGSPVHASPVRIEVRGLPLAISADGTLKDGGAWFSAIPYLERDLHVTVEAAGATHRLDRNHWRRDGEIRLLAPGDAAIDRVIEVRGVEGEIEVQALAPRGSSYGVVPTRREEDRITVRLPPGEFALLLRAGDRWAQTRLLADGAAPVLSAGDFVPGTSVRVQTHGVGGGVVRFLRSEEGREVLGQGFVATVTQTGEIDSFLPAGTYRIVWAYEGGEVRPAAPFTFVAGGQLVLPLDAPRR